MFTAHAGFTQPRSLIARRRKPSGSLSANLLFNKANMKKKRHFPPPSGAEIYSCEKSQSPAEPGCLQETFTGLSFHCSLEKSCARRLSPH